MEYISSRFEEDIASLYESDEDDDEGLDLDSCHLTALKMSKLHRPFKQPGKPSFSPFRVIPPISPPPTKQKDNGLIVTSALKSPVPNNSQQFGSQTSLKSHDSVQSVGKNGTSPGGKQVHVDSKANQKEDKGQRKGNNIIPSDQLDKSVKLIGYKLTNPNAATTPPSPAPTNSTRWVPPGSELPPCKICGEKSSGLHYGVYTCEACKAFYRRALKRVSVDFNCSCNEEERRKNQEGPRKTTCPKCRYERCVKEGMSVDAIKIGRYSITRKRQNDREVNLLKEKTNQKSPEEPMSAESSPGTAKSSSSDSPYSSSQSVRSPEEITSDITTLNIDGNVNAAKKMRPDPDPSTGMLFRSLQNSIIRDIKATTTLDLMKVMGGDMNPASPDFTPMEMLFMQPYNPLTDNGTIPTSTDSLSFQFGAPVTGNDIMTFTGQPLNSFNNTPVVTSQEGMAPAPLTNVSDAGSMYLQPGKNNTVITYQPNSDPREAAPDSDKILELFLSGENSLPNNHPSSIEDLLTDPLSDLSPGSQTLSPASQGKQMYDVNSPLSQGKQMYDVNSPPSQGKQMYDATSPLSQGKQMYDANSPLSQGKQMYDANNPLSQGKQMHNANSSPSQGKQIYNAGNQPISPPSQGKQIYNAGNQLDLDPSLYSNAMTTGALPYTVQVTGDLQDDYMNSAIEKLLDGNCGAPSDDLVQTLVDAESSLVDLSQFDINQLPEAAGGCQSSQLQLASKFDNMQWREKTEPQETEQELEDLADLEDTLNNDKELYPAILDLDQECSLTSDSLVQEYFCNFMCPSLVIGIDVSVDDVCGTIKELWDCAKMLDQMKCCITGDDIRKRHTEYLEKYRQKMELLGQLGSISKQEYIEVYKQTGIELDDRKQIVVEFLKYTESSIKKMILFVKCIPGFTELHVEDQATLLKAARFEQTMIRLIEGLCPITNQVLTTPWKKEYHIEELNKVLPKEFLSCKQQVMQSIQKLGLTQEEAAVLRALAVCCPERPGLLERDKVRYVFERMLLCLHYLLDQRSPDNRLTMMDIGQTLIPVRKLADWETKLVLEFFEVWPVADDHNLVKEFVQ